MPLLTVDLLVIISVEADHSSVDVFGVNFVAAISIEEPEQRKEIFVLGSA